MNYNPFSNNAIQKITSQIIPKKKTQEELNLEKTINNFYNNEEDNLEQTLLRKALFSEYNSNKKYNIIATLNKQEEKQKYAPLALIRLCEKHNLNKENTFLIKKDIYESYKTFMNDEKGILI